MILCTTSFLFLSVRGYVENPHLHNNCFDRFQLFLSYFKKLLPSLFRHQKKFWLLGLVPFTCFLCSISRGFALMRLQMMF